MDKEMIFSVVIPVLLIGVLVYYNLHKLKSKAHDMEEKCQGNCSGCAHKHVCSSSTEEEALSKKES